jgi:hypothetical protein
MVDRMKYSVFQGFFASRGARGRVRRARNRALCRARVPSSARGAPPKKFFATRAFFARDTPRNTTEAPRLMTRAAPEARGASAREDDLGMVVPRPPERRQRALGLVVGGDGPGRSPATALQASADGGSARC